MKILKSFFIPYTKQIKKKINVRMMNLQKA